MGRVIIQSKMTLGGWRERQGEAYTPGSMMEQLFRQDQELLPELESWNGWVRPAAVGDPIPGTVPACPPSAGAVSVEAAN